MKELTRKVLADNRGSAITVFILVLLPLLILYIVCSAEISRNTTAADVDLQGAVTLAVKGAAQSVNAASQAAGDLKIDPSRANQNFKKILARNLGFNEETWQPLTGAGVVKLNYHLLVYNGSAGYGVPAGSLYSIVEGIQSESGLAEAGLPYDFGIGENQFCPLSSAVKKVVLDKPGCIAIVEAEISPAMANKGPVAVRWAAAKIRTNY